MKSAVYVKRIESTQSGVTIKSFVSKSNHLVNVCNICQTFKSRMRMSRTSLQAFLRGQAPPADKGGREGVPLLGSGYH